MSARVTFLQAIKREPNNDALRLAYADWLGGHGDAERAEFIRVQIDSERYQAGSSEHERQTERAVELLSRHRTQWIAGYESAIPAGTDLSLGRPYYHYEQGIRLSNLWFRRGFVDEIVFRDRSFFLLDCSDIRPTGPLPILRLQFFHPGSCTRLGPLEDFVEQLAAAPLLSCFREVRLEGGFSGTTDEGLRLLANEPSLLAKLGGLCLSEDEVGDPGILPILESPHLIQFRELAIDCTKCTEAVLHLLIHSDRFRGMTYLRLDYTIAGGRGLRLFGSPGRWPQLRCLCIGDCGLDDLTLRGLMRPGAFPSVELLDLHSSQIRFHAIQALLQSGAFPKLQVLGLGGLPLTLNQVEALQSEFGHQVKIHFPVPRKLRPADETSS